MINILITSAGQRVSLVRAFKETILKYGQYNKVYTIDSNPYLAPACHVSDGFKMVPKVDDSKYIDIIIDICREWKINIVIPTIDNELQVLSKYKDLFISNGINLIISDFEFVNTCRDKRKLNKFYSTRKIRIPKLFDKINPQFPLFIKPYDGSLSKDIFVVNNRNELTEYQKNNEKLMFMEYIDHNYFDEYTVDTYYNKNNNIVSIVPRKRIFVRAGEINKGSTIKNELIEFIKKHLQFIPGAIGCLTMQFFFNSDTKEIIGIEINPRFGGGYPLSYRAGANFPQLIIEEYIFNKDVEYSENWEDKLLMLRYDDEVIIHNYEEKNSCI